MKRIGWWIGVGLGGSLMAQVWHSPVAAQTPPIWIGSPPTSQVSTTIAGLTPNSAAAAAFNSNLINSAIQNIATLGGGQLVIPCGSYYVAGPIDNNVQGVTVSGSGSANSWQFPTSNGAFSPAPTTCVTIVATAANDILVHRTPHSSSTPVFMGGGFENITVDGAGIAHNLLWVDDVSKSKYILSLKNGAGAQAALLSVGVGNVDCNGPCYNQQIYADITIDQRETSTAGLVMTGSTNGDTALSTIILRTETGTGIPLDYQGDNNVIWAYLGQSGASYGLLARCGNGLSQQPGGFTRFVYVTTLAPIYAQGTNDSGCVHAAGPNKIENLDVVNDTPLPTAGTGSYWDYWANNAPAFNSSLGIGYQFIVNAGSTQTQIGGALGAGNVQIGTGTTASTIAASGGLSGQATFPVRVYAGSSVAGSNDTLRVINNLGTCNHTAGASSETVSCSSDVRLKTDIVDASSALDWLKGFRIRDYTVKSDGSKATGVIAQETQDTHPEVVHEGEDGILKVDQPNPWKLVKAIQELQNRLDALEAAH